jgi:hypothetical protein
MILRFQYFLNQNIMKNKNSNQKKMYWLGGGLAAFVVVALVAGTAGGLFQGALFPNLKLSAPSKVLDGSQIKLADGVVKPQGGPSLEELNKDVTRAELIQLIANRYVALGKGSVEPKALGCFADAVGHSNEKAICWALEQKYVQALPDGLFHVNQSVSRAEAAKLFKQVFFATTSNSDALKNQLFSDVPLDAWFASYVNELALLDKAMVKPNLKDLSKSWFFPGTALTKGRATYWLNTF